MDKLPGKSENIPIDPGFRAIMFTDLKDSTPMTSLTKTTIFKNVDRINQRDRNHHNDMKERMPFALRPFRANARVGDKDVFELDVVRPGAAKRISFSSYRRIHVASFATAVNQCPGPEIR